jgi:hypothetical protein
MPELPIRDSVPLGKWLDVATKKLSTESKYRVGQEIHEHFVSAKEEALSAGVNPQEAGRIALDSLGSARVANRAYRKVLLTAWEAENLERIKYEWPPSSIFITGALCFGMLISAIGIYTGYTRVTLAGPSLIIPIVASLLVPARSRVGGRVYRYAMWIMLGVLLCSMGDWKSIAYFTVCFGMVIWPYLRACAELRRKLPIGKWPDGLFM